MTESGVEMFCPACAESFPVDTQVCPHDGTKLIRVGDRRDALIGKTIQGRFEIKSRLGAGGMGVVYRASQLSLGRDVAIKLMHPSPLEDVDATKRFLREARLASQIANPHTVSIVDFGQTEDGALFLAMELLEGETMSGRLKRTGPMQPKVLVPILSQIVQALTAAHKLDVVHRDLKPANIFLLERDFVKVLDFGLAKFIGEVGVTSTGMLVGTPAYVAPEIALGAQASLAADYYALGVVAFEALTGELPFLAETPSAFLIKHVYDTVPNLPDSVPRGLRVLVGRLLEKEPDKRLTRNEEVLTILEDIRAGREVEGPWASTRMQRPSVIDELSQPTPAAPAPAQPLPVTRPPSAPSRPPAALADTFIPKTLPTPLPASPKTREAEAPARRNILPLAIAVAGALGLTTFFLVREPPEQPTPPDRKPAVDASAPTPVEKAPQRTQVTLEVTSVPPGARVLLGNDTLGKTPLVLTATQSDVRRALLLRLDGFEPLEFGWVPSHDQKMSLELKGSPKKPKPAATPDVPF